MTKSRKCCTNCSQRGYAVAGAVHSPDCLIFHALDASCSCGMMICPSCQGTGQKNRADYVRPPTAPSLLNGIPIEEGKPIDLYLHEDCKASLALAHACGSCGEYWGAFQRGGFTWQRTKRLDWGGIRVARTPDGWPLCLVRHHSDPNKGPQ